ncbi:F-box/LRR-repeat protein 20 F-box and leucine-rich repeat protein 20 [Collichthys lucidus]|uniref:F-box/LRR-repeat protein 20 F-box and leucine-rich repeat protein 20 n=1 Tax=Collichthys lucidus TaxID=240159 RepID=A0A4U5VJJ6_COLLU|nr:F-box/LRR-repeat protein 20 F-box and leucine-rich repeat protein 20 [Collichthys lucidus]
MVPFVHTGCKEIFTIIFSYLDVVTLCRCAQVSKAWNVLALDGSNWQKIDLFNFQTDIEDIRSELQKHRSAEPERLHQDHRQHLSQPQQVLLQTQTARSDLLCVHQQPLPKGPQNCHELEKMDLEECILVTDNTLVQLSIHCPRLQALVNLYTCSSNFVPRSTGREKSLSHCELITDDGIRALSSSTCGQERLTVVELDNCPLITDVTLEHLKSCHRLERIELYDCQQVTRAGIKRIRAHLPEIKVHAYFAPVTPPPSVHGGGQRLCRCCIIL